MRHYHGSKPLVRFEDAFERLMSSVRPINRTETVSLTECIGRVLAETVTAPFDVPPFDRAAMDGYAVRSSEISSASSENPVTLRVIGTVYAGDPPPNWEVSGRTCAQIATGAPIPPGADTVVPFEDTRREGKTVFVFKDFPEGKNITQRASDLAEGMTVLTEGTLLTPAKVGVLAALGFESTCVYAKPKLAILPTGEEVAKPGKPLRAGQIYDTNTYTVAALAKQHGCQPLLMEVLPDEEPALRQALQDALGVADMVIFSGGSAVGERDFLPRLLSEFGTVLFHGVAVRPGRPTLTAIVDEKLIVNLPGFPASCLTMAYMFLVPAWRKMARLPEWQPKIVKATLANDVRSPEGLLQFLTVRVRDGIAEVAYKESGTITSLSEADGYIVIPETVTHLPMWTVVNVTLF